MPPLPFSLTVVFFKASRLCLAIHSPVIPLIARGILGLVFLRLLDVVL